MKRLQSIANKIWLRPDLLKSLKAIVAIVLVAFPFIFSGHFQFAVSLILGVIAAGVAETEDHFKGQAKSLGLMILMFFGMVSLVYLKRIDTLLYQITYLISVMGLVIIGGIGERYRGLSNGALLASIYAMLGSYLYSSWFFQPIFITSGAVAYGAITLLVLSYKPIRPLEEQLAEGFGALSDYLNKKSFLLKGDSKQSETLNRQLAELNIRVVTALEKCKNLLNNYADDYGHSKELKLYLRKFILLQSFHERVSANPDYLEDKTITTPEIEKIMAGYSELFQQLAIAATKVSESLLLSKVYLHPLSIDLIIEALGTEIEKLPAQERSKFILFYHNLKRSSSSLKKLSRATLDSVPPEFSKDTRTVAERIKDQLTFKHPRMRYAIRLTLCFAAGFALIDALDLQKGEWVLLTSLLVNQPSYSDTRKRFFQRILGTLSGVLLAISLILIIPTHAGQLLIIVLSVAAFLYYKYSNYSLAVVFVTAYVLCSNNFIDNSGIDKILPRIVDTLIGAFLAFLAVRFLWPDWQYKRLPFLLSEAFKGNAAYVSEIVNECIIHPRPKDYNDLAYRIARRKAHKADNALSLSWRSMRIEPKSQRRFLEKAFTLTYLNHALLSNISTLSIGRYTKGFLNAELQQILNQVESALITTADQLTGMSENAPLRLHPILLELRDKINLSEDEDRTQKLRLIYNLVNLADKLMKTSDELIEELKSKTPGKSDFLLAGRT